MSLESRAGKNKDNNLLRREPDKISERISMLNPGELYGILRKG
jgi:hypothetical protein